MRSHLKSVPPRADPQDACERLRKATRSASDFARARAPACTRRSAQVVLKSYVQDRVSDPVARARREYDAMRRVAGPGVPACARPRPDQRATGSGPGARSRSCTGAPPARRAAGSRDVARAGESGRRDRRARPRGAHAPQGPDATRASTRRATGRWPATRCRRRRVAWRGSRRTCRARCSGFRRPSAARACTVSSPRTMRPPHRSPSATPRT